jgi:hypothetical protein
MRQAYKPGSFVRIPLTDGSFSYGRILEPPYDAFYDYRTPTPNTDLDRIATKPILFRIAVRYSRSNPWTSIGWREIDERLAQPLVLFRQDVGNLRRCMIYDTTGKVRNAEPHECIGIERSAVWEQHAVEERLLDAFMGRPNATVERLKVRLQ